MKPKKQLVPNEEGWWWRWDSNYKVWKAACIFHTSNGMRWVEDFNPYFKDLLGDGLWGGKCNTPKWKPKLK